MTNLGKFMLAAVGVIAVLGLGGVTAAGAAEPLRVPELRAPGEGASIATIDQPVTFNWGSVYDAQWYDLQISTDPGFGSVSVTRTRIAGTTYVLQDAKLGGGVYYWRVTAGNSARPGTWSAGRKLNVVLQNVPLGSPSTVPYLPSSPWNTPILPGAPVDPRSAEMMGTMAWTTTGGKIWSETTKYSYPVYYADASTPRYDLRCGTYKCTVVVDGTVMRVEWLRSVPIPNGAKPSDGTDGQMIIIDTASGNEFGLYRARLDSTGQWVIANGYRYNVRYSGTPVPFGSRGSGVPYQAGLIRPWEIRAGEIKHALAFAYNYGRQGSCVYPATQTDGVTTSASAIPYGARIQLNPALTEADFDRMGLSRAGRIVARALQQYGMYLVDRSTTPKIYAEDLTANLLSVEEWSDPDLGYSKELIENIPYQEFRVLALPAAYWNTSLPAAPFGKCIAYP